MNTETVLEKLRAKIIEKSEPEPYSGCWIWTGASVPDGYGQLWHENKPQLAHRLSFLAFKHPLGTKLACHTCDTPACVNPNHLFAGTFRDNIVDAYSKDRRRGKINPTQWTEIKVRLDRGESRRVIAKDYGVHHSAITWRKKHGND